MRQQIWTNKATNSMNDGEMNEYNQTSWTFLSWFKL